jgi:hypothetical protein
MNIPASLDRFVRATRLDFGSLPVARRSRNFRWLPLLSLVALAIGYAMLVAASRGVLRWEAGLIGITIFFLAFAGAGLLRAFGPRLTPGIDQPLDEREMMVRAQAGNISGAILAVLVALGCFYGGYAAVYGTWMPAHAIEWVFLGLGVIAYALILPVLVGSWLQSPPDEEE